MANIDVWIQMENNKWDTAPHNIDRMSGQNIAAAEGKGPFPGITLTSPVTGATRTVTMFLPMLDAGGSPIDSLIFRRYTPNWAAPDDRKVNAWDLNELNPTDGGSMGTIPGPVIECNVGDQVTVHFRNMDNRVGKDTLARAHSMHVHGFVFANAHDGAYPLSPPDPAQPVGAEAALWSMVGVTGNKRGDRVPPGGSFTYTWKTLGWPTTSGVWLYHDHSVCDMENIDLGAIGIVVIHDPNDLNDVVVTPADLPGGSVNGSPILLRCTPFPADVAVLPHDLIPDLHALVPIGPGGPRGEVMAPTAPVATAHAGPMPGMRALTEPASVMSAGHVSATRLGDTHPVDVDSNLRTNPALLIQRGDFQFQLATDLTKIIAFCHRNFRAPPVRELILQLYLDRSDGTVLINGRKYLGNTPTIVAGGQSKMRFGVVGMGSSAHTFHLHGHRWVIPGAQGTAQNANNDLNNPMIDITSQFEDTRIFGPANSFTFTVQEGTSFMRAEPAIGEWHMHCHVLSHMFGGMMGSLLIVNGGELFFGLPSGQPCPPDVNGPAVVNIIDNAFSPVNLAVAQGTSVRWVNTGTAPHTTTSNPGPSACAPSSTENWSSPVLNTGDHFDHVFPTAGSFSYHCEVHGCAMHGTITVT